MPKIPKDIVENVRKRLDPTPCGLVRKLVAAGHQAYIVGGAVRDLLLQQVPKDYDITTSATPEEIRAVFGRRRCHIIGRRFRLVHVYANGDIYEVSTFRKVPSEGERHGKHPEAEDHIIWNDNCFGTLEDDATRRDFTANSLYFDVVGDRGIIDFWDGYKDIQKRIVRCIGAPAARMEEDPVRMLRALKLAGQFEFQIEEELAETIRRQGEDIKLASPSRLFEELLKILKHPNADRTLLEMHNFGFLAHFWNLLDTAWEEQEGVLTRHLLKLRGEAIRRGRYSNSRGLALATVSMPFLMTAMNPGHPTDFWSGSLSYNPTAQRAVGVIFEGFNLPNAFAHRILDIAGLCPRFLRGTNPQKLFRNEEYRYGRALLALLVQAFGWDAAKILGNYPEFSPTYSNWQEDDNSELDPENTTQNSAPEEETQPHASSEPSAVPQKDEGTAEVTQEQPKQATTRKSQKTRKRPRRKTAAMAESPDTPAPQEPTEAHDEPELPAPEEKSAVSNTTDNMTTEDFTPSNHHTIAAPLPSGKLVPLAKIQKKRLFGRTETVIEVPVHGTEKQQPQPRVEFEESSAPKLEVRAVEASSPGRLVSLRKNGSRVPLPTKYQQETPQPSIAKVEFDASLLTAPPRKYRPAGKAETITFSPTQKTQPRKTSFGKKASGRL